MRFKILGLTTVAALVSVLSSNSQAIAGTLYNGWNYSIDAVGDGSGGAIYDVKGIAIRETNESVWVALSGNTPLTGVGNDRAQDGNIGWGDLFFNFSGKDFQTANQTNSLLGIRFAATNDSKAPSVGVYKNVNATSVASANAGYSSLENYYQAGYDKANTVGTDFATKEAAYQYFSKGSVPNVINSGTKVGDIAFLSSNQLSEVGLDFGHFSATGSQIIGFKLDKSLMSSGDFIANLFLECLNDGVAIKGTMQPVKHETPSQAVPEPTTMGGIGMAVGALLWTRRRKVGNALN